MAPRIVERAAAESMPPGSRLAIALLLAASFVMALNQTSTGIALPHLMRDFAVAEGQAQWVDTVYRLAMAVALPCSAYLIDRFGTRGVFIGAVATFVAGSLICASALDLPMMLTGRALQAIGTAPTGPLAAVAVMAWAPPNRRGRVLADMTMVLSVGPVVGLVAAGAALQAMGWRGNYAAMAVLAAVSLAMALRSLPREVVQHRARLDLLSVALAAVGFTGAVAGLSLLARGESVDLRSAIGAAVGVLALGAFAARQANLLRAGRAPLLDLRPLRRRAFACAVVAMMLLGSCSGVQALLLPVLLQETVGSSPGQVGLLLLPGSAALALAASVSGRLHDRCGPRAPALVGGALTLGGLVALALVSSSATPATVAAAFTATSAGLGLAMTPLLAAALESVTAEQRAHGSAFTYTGQQVTSAAAVAVLLAVAGAQRSEAISAGASGPQAVAAGIGDAMAGAAAIAAAGIAFVVALRPRAASRAPGEPLGRGLPHIHRSWTRRRAPRPEPPSTRTSRRSCSTSTGS